jgi:thioredoxin reductase (NADPH)
LLVVGLCAAWCGTCREFAPVFERLATKHQDATFLWLDVEDDSELAGDLDVENFPTLAIFREGRPVYFGISLPQEGIVGRLLEAMASAEYPRSLADPELAKFYERIRTHAELAS